MIGRTTCDACSASWNIVCCAGHNRASDPNCAPVLGLRSQRGKFALAMSNRIRWPALNTFAVDQRSILNLYGLPGSKSSGLSPLR